MFAARETLQLFPTLVTCYRVAEAEARSRALCAQVAEASRMLPTVARGERHGWQSDNGFFDWSDEARWLRDVVAGAIVALHPDNAALPGMNLVGWANRLGRGDAFSPHVHSAAWSGVYYADAGDSGAAGGLLLLRDPRAGAHMVESPTSRFDGACSFQIAPETGLLVVFPSWLMHWVSPYDGERPRVSISFNVW